MRTKSAKFSPPFNVQFIENLADSNDILVSDGRMTKTVTLSSKYDYLFELNIVETFDIMTFYEVQRIGRFDIFVDNMMINKDYQVDNTKIGEPTIFTLWVVHLIFLHFPLKEPIM